VILSVFLSLFCVNNVGGQHRWLFAFLAACYKLTLILCFFSCLILLLFVANKFLLLLLLLLLSCLLQYPLPGLVSHVTHVCVITNDSRHFIITNNG